MHDKRLLRLLLTAAGILVLSARRKPGEPLRPSGLNFFSPQQDVQLGQEAAAEVRKQVVVVAKRRGRRLSSCTSSGNA
jgi:hypothetical protein